MHHFLQSCQDAKDLDEKIFKYLYFALNQDCISKGQFNCNPPGSLLDLFQATSSRGHQDITNKHQLRHCNALSGIVGGDKDKTQDYLVKNMSKNQIWLLNNKEDYFIPPSREMWKENPPPADDQSRQIVVSSAQRQKVFISIIAIVCMKR